jgi:hypothetical protein
MSAKSICAVFTVLSLSPILYAAPADLDLSTLNGSTGFRIVGVAAGALAGSAVAGVGDLNGDAIPDFAIGAPGTAFGASTEQGQVYVFFGRTAANPWPASLDPSTLNGSNGFVINGVDAGDQLGAAIARAAGDLNGDGRRDLLIGAPKAGAAIAVVPAVNYGAGEAYVLFGRASWPAVIDLGQPLAANSGFRMISTGPSFFGVSLSGVGDFNGDGRDDAVICADGGDNNSQGLSQRCYLLYGRANGVVWPGVLNLALLPATEAIPIVSAFAPQASQRIGHSVAGVGDVNGDGRPDVLVGGPRQVRVTGDIGGFYLSFGSALVQPNVLGVSLPNDNCAAGEAVAGLGDFNGDGRPDFIVGRPPVYMANTPGVGNVCGNPSTLNQSSIYYGTASGTSFSSSTITHATGGGFQGRAVAQLGDVNGDGIADLAIGDPAYSPYAANTPTLPGEAFILMGRVSPAPPANIDLSANQGMLVARLKGVSAADQAATALAGVGDINGDGMRDILIGAPGVDVAGSNAGAAYVVFGNVNLGIAPPPPQTATVTQAFSAVGLYGQGVTIRARVSVPGSVSGDPRAEGMVNISATGGTSCSGALVVQALFSEMSCVLPISQIGVQTVTANYLGNASFGASSGSGSAELQPTRPSLSIVSHLPQPSAIGQAMTTTVSASVVGTSYVGPVIVTIAGGTESCTIDFPSSNSCAMVLTVAGDRAMAANIPASAVFLSATANSQHTVFGVFVDAIFRNGFE